MPLRPGAERSARRLMINPRARAISILHEYRYLLPDHIRRSKMLIAWKVPRKLAGILCTFKYTKPKGHLPNLPHSSSPPPAARGRGTLSP